jgi:hypothetical protein
MSIYTTSTKHCLVLGYYIDNYLSILNYRHGKIYTKFGILNPIYFTNGQRYIRLTNK